MVWIEKFLNIALVIIGARIKLIFWLGLVPIWCPILLSDQIDQMIISGEVKVTINVVKAFFVQRQARGISSDTSSMILDIYKM